MKTDSYTINNTNKVHHKLGNLYYHNQNMDRVEIKKNPKILKRKKYQEAEKG